MSKAGDVFQKRLKKHHDELKWLYMELYRVCSADKKG